MWMNNVPRRADPGSLQQSFIAEEISQDEYEAGLAEWANYYDDYISAVNPAVLPPSKEGGGVFGGMSENGLDDVAAEEEGEVPETDEDFDDPYSIVARQWSTCHGRRYTRRRGCLANWTRPKTLNIWRIS